MRSTEYVSDTVIKTKDAQENKTDKIPCPNKAYTVVGEDNCNLKVRYSIH